jgi:hypothetical protein
MGFKEMLLIGFFLSIGLTATPTLNSLYTAGILILILPIKLILFYIIIQIFKKRTRTSLLASLNLFSYSEFGLIVGGVAVRSGWISVDWLIAIAIALSISFLISSSLNEYTDTIYQKIQGWLNSVSENVLISEDYTLPGDDKKILILGMGRIGKGAYDYLINHYPGQICGLEMLPELTAHHIRAKRSAINADATDPDFWETMKHSGKLFNVALIILAMPKHRSNRFALDQLRGAGFKGIISAICMYEDQIDELLEAGANTAFNFYSEAGVGLGEHVYRVYEEKLQDHLNVEIA